MINGITSDLIEIFHPITSLDIRRYLSNYNLANRQRVQYVVTDMNANYGTTLRAMFPNAHIVVDYFHIIQLAMKAVQSTRSTVQRAVDNKRSRVYKLLKSNWQFFITDQSKIDTVQDVLQLVFGLSPKFKQAYQVYQTILSAQRSRSFNEFSEILSQYEPNHSEMDQLIVSYKKNLKDIRNAFSKKHSNERIEGINRRIKQIGRTAYGYGNSLNYFFRIRLQLSNRQRIDASFMNLLTKKSLRI